MQTLVEERSISQLTRRAADDAVERGREYLKACRWDEAAHEFRKAVEMDPDFGPPHVYLANLYHIYKEMIDESIDEYRKALELGGIDSEDEFIVYNNLGFIYRSKGMYEEALQCFAKAASIKPNVSYIHWKIATIYAAQGKIAEAVASLRRAIELGQDLKCLHRLDGWLDKIKDSQEFQSLIRELKASHPG